MGYQLFLIIFPLLIPIKTYSRIILVSSFDAQYYVGNM